jgi:AraC-like DNA-binding protein
LLVVALSVQNIKFYYLGIVLDNHISTIGGNPEYNIQSLAFPLTGILFIGPALYFYARSLTNREFRFNYRHAWHFVPGTLFIFINSLVFFGIATADDPPAHGFVISLFSIISTAENLLAISLSFYYIVLSVKLIRGHEVWVYQHFSTTSRKSLQWLRNLVISLSLVWIIWLFAVVINIFTHDFILTYLSSYPFQIATSVIIFWIGYVGFIHGEIFSMEISFEKKINSLKPTIKKEPETNTEVKNALLKAMESDKLFLIPDLSLAMLAHQLNITQKNISQALNNDLKRNFHDFINEYRVEEVKKRLVDPSFDHFTILAVAMDSGFNSKSSFNRIFMKITGMSPKQFREKQRIAGSK